MIASNPFAELAAVIPPAAMQAYVVLMLLLVVIGTVLDMRHKKSARYFFENARKARKNATRTLGAGEKSALALKTVGKEVLTSGEFNNQKRRISHLFTMYGFIIFVVTTAILIFAYPTPDDSAPTILPQLWHLGAAMLCLGGYWFWFSIRVDVASEGVKWHRLNGRGDLFIVGLLGMATFALLWSFTMGLGMLNMLFFVLFVAFSTLLFGSVYWSKFAHMFFKPAAAFQKRVIKADGSRENMPAIYDPSDPEVQARFPDVPAYMGVKPPNMGLGIKREAPNHF
ncbi:MAG: adenylyl-sulfate reductase [Thiobacillus sp.]|uniref:adenylyl-sulfate reductase n=1 Tax=Thiobacillus sp. TaxID=924 RepID=UPI0028943EF6|nr:adenylyl-sulfate reductase [Thiobacillus sp.]MDT3707566.1 adenylyl-sulfate reductase [Thiobacillus sp.]